MNPDETKSVITKVLLVLLTSLSTSMHLSESAGTLATAASDIADLAVLFYGIYSHRGMKKVPETAKVIGGLVLLGLLLALPTSGRAADLVPLKAAPKANFLSAAYPSANGFYFGIGTLGGGGKVAASVPGVNGNSLVSNEIGVGGIVGYVWNVPNSAYFAAVESWFGVTNFNGSAPGFSLNGPATFTQRVMVGAPLNDIAGMFPTWNLAPPPFPPLPNGQAATNIKPYLFGSLTEEDVSVDFGVASNRDWRFSPGMGVGMLGQLTSGSVIDVFAMTKFPQKGVCVGNGLPAGQACGGVGTTYLAGLALKW